LIPLFLFQKKVLASPMFYLSEYLEAHRETYYARLRAISDSGGWTGWIEFFLEAVQSQATSNALRVTAILNLYNDMKNRVREITHSQYTPTILDALFDRPVFQTLDFANRSQVPKPTVTTSIRKLREAGILVEIRPASGRRAAILAFPELLNLAEGKKVL
jgi:Fic family protein